MTKNPFMRGAACAILAILFVAACAVLGDALGSVVAWALTP